MSGVYREHVVERTPLRNGETVLTYRVEEMGRNRKWSVHHFRIVVEDILGKPGAQYETVTPTSAERLHMEMVQQHGKDGGVVVELHPPRPATGVLRVGPVLPKRPRWYRRWLKRQLEEVNQ